MKAISLFLLSFSGLFSTVLLAEGDPQQGKALSAVCATCHGADGIALMPTYPNLAGQNEAYLVYALKTYRSKQRQGDNAALMHAMAANLSDEDIANLAAYYASLK